MRNRKLSIILGIILLVLVFGIGYAYLTTTLSINGTTNVDSNTWNVYWDNVQVTTGSVSASTPTISNQTAVSFNVHLSKPGDYYEFTVDAKNDGSIDAMIDTITKTINNETTIPNYLNYIVTYSDGAEIRENQLLSANDKETYKVRVEYRTDINPSDLPGSAQSLNIVFGVTYVQADNNAIQIETTFYSIDSVSFTIGSSVPEGVTLFNNYQDVFSISHYPFFLKHTISHNVVNSSYVGFVLNNNVYYQQGGINEENLSTKPVYESNKEILLSAFGSSNCTENSTSFGCSTSSPVLTVVAHTNGLVQAYDGGWECYVNSEGRSSCGTW